MIWDKIALDESDIVHRLTQNTVMPDRVFFTKILSRNCRAVAEFNTVFSNILVIQKNIAQYNGVFSICINFTSTKYGQLDMEYFENLVWLPEIETQASFLSKCEFKLKL